MAYRAGLNWRMVYLEIVRASEVAVRRTAIAAQASATARAPVRKVFTGGRNSPRSKYHTLSEAELRQEAQILNTGQELKFSDRTTQRQYDAARSSGVSIEDAMVRIRRGTQVAPRTSNRANTAQGSYYLRGVKFETVAPQRQSGSQITNTIELSVPTRELAHEGARNLLSARGRYELEKVGRGSITASGTLGGHLRGSIHMENRNANEVVKVAVVAGGEEAPYARFVEFGTRHAPAQPFLRPALKHAEGKFPGMLRNELRKMGH